ncbi:hypothetical protein BOX15_Mlig033711g3 [Macrostomum lignano]|uniref:Glycosyl hydrolase family 13 catalytic domain-containing protein n=1 Tax=Macrostomum lignano TaxID=282301 RepID=A0A267GKM8_9PLAT|nr:hypothetical protein BOX15_Mlig033711g3 [Macrostomum lignano]
MVNPEANADLPQSQAESDSQEAAAEALARKEDQDADEGTPLVEIKSPGDKIAEADETGQSTSKKPTPDAEFSCLTKEDLEHFAKDPFWRRLRLIFFFLFWAVWAAMLAAVVVIIVVSPRCPPRPPRQFWQKPIYRLSVKAFAPASDADPTALGSVEGLAKKMDYLRNTLGFNNFILDSLVTREPTSGCIADFKAYNSSLVSLESLKSLTKLGRKKGFSFLMEFDASQASSAWGSGAFLTTVEPQAPLASRDGGPAWRDSQLHLPRSRCLSLNVTDAQVAEKIEAALSFWLDAGLSGFVLTNVAFMAPRRAPPADAPPGLNGKTWSDADPTALLFSNDSVKFVRQIRQFINAQAEKRGRELALFVEPGNTGFPQPPDRLAAYLDKKNGAHAVISTALGASLSSAPAKWTSPRKVVLDTLGAAGSNDSVLFATAWSHLRRPKESHLTALSLLLPGVPCLYYGQELGMAHVAGVSLLGEGLSSYLSGNESTDASETPMQWSGSAANAGWLSNTSASLAWVDLSPRAADIELHNLRLLSSTGHPKAQSQLELVKSVLTLIGGSESLQWGGIEFLATRDDSLVAFKREAERFPPVLVIMNTGDKAATLGLAKQAKVTTGTLKVLYNAGGGSTSYVKDQEYSLDVVFVPAKSILAFLGKD